jgi:NAD(P)H dehydrogenase (quinone)
MTNISIAYHSGYGHTTKVAEKIKEGIDSVSGYTAQLIKVDTINEADWTTLDQAKAIVFGAPTYMGGISAPFKTFLDATSKRWFGQAWKNKLAAGFTNSGSLSGDKLASLQQLFTTAMQHGMIWVGQGEMGASAKGTEVTKPTDINRMGSFSGLMTQSNNESTEIAPPKGDLETARLFGIRIAEICSRFRD